MPKLRLTGRSAALVGVIAAGATATLVAVAGPAMAAPTKQTTCSDTVRVRSQPSATAPVIGSCRAGENVTVDETRNGYSHLVNKQGWASSEYVKGGSNSGNSYDSNGKKKYKKDYYYDSNGKKKYRDGNRNGNNDYYNRGSGGGLLGG